jgi:Uma2 family endonuclease
MTLREYLRCEDAPGYKVDIIDGVVRVSPSPNIDHQMWQRDLFKFLDRFAEQNRSEFNLVTTDNDVVVPFRPGPTRPRPDVCAYRAVPPRETWGPNPDWAQFCPILVAEIISKRRAAKDTERNRELYWSAGGIAEYWIVDPRANALEPELIALVREAGVPNWRESRVAFGDSWKSPNLVGLAVNLREIRRDVY